MILVAITALLVGFSCNGRFVSACDRDKFPCDDGSCIEKEYWCDSEPHCKDHSDEKYCFQKSNLRPVPNKCNETFFVCKTGPCIPIVGRCDGYISCRDGSDEEGCKYRRSKTEGPQEVTVGITYTEKIDTMYLNYTKNPPITEDFKELTTKSTAKVHAKNDNVDTVQSDLASVGMHHTDDFHDMDPFLFKRQKSLAQKWLLSVRDFTFGWGSETPRALIALYMSDYLGSREDELLMSKQLHVQLFTALMRNRTAPIPLWDLSLFINALSASCDDPKNFYGQNLVEILRQRTDRAKQSSVITPVVYLTLCLNGATTYNDLVKLIEIMNYASKMDKIDTEALVSLSATCISRIPAFHNISSMIEISTKLYSKIERYGLPKSIYKLALVTQALNEARINENEWNRSEAMHLISSHQRDNGSFGDILSTYYTMPLLSGRSLLSLGHHCGSSRNKDSIPLDTLNSEDTKKIYVKYSLYFNDPVEVSQTIMMKIKNMTCLLDIMRMAGDINPVYKFSYDMINGKPEVYSIGGIVNDPESGLYWKLYVSSSHEAIDRGNLPFEGDIKSFKPDDASNIVFWLKSLY